MDVFIVLFIGFLLGGFYMYALSGGEPIGTLRIDTSDPDDGPYLFLELSKDLNRIRNKKYVTLKVNSNDYISRK